MKYITYKYKLSTEEDLNLFNEDEEIIYLGSLEETESGPINIDLLISLLQAAREDASHVCIDYHTDHQSYIIQPVDIYSSSEEEIEKYS